MKSLTVSNSNQKLNFFAKQFKNIEKLSIRRQNYSWLYELDSGIVNENVKELKLETCSNLPYRHDGKIFEPPLLEVCGIFPNLEVFHFKGRSISLKSSIKFFEEYQHLKSFQLDKLPLKNFKEVVEDLNSFMRRVEKIEFGISFNEHSLRESRKFARLQKKFKGQFKFERWETGGNGDVTYRMIKL
jgi:hypothetical protein